jgi:hypothetical protein
MKLRFSRIKLCVGLLSRGSGLLKVVLGLLNLCLHFTIFGSGLCNICIGLCEQGLGLHNIGLGLLILCLEISTYV